MSSLRQHLLLAGAALAGAGSGALHAATLYVSQSGSDGNNGSFSQPFLTIAHAISMAAPFDTINVIAGPNNSPYVENLLIDKNLRLEGLPTAIIQPAGSGPVITVSDALSPILSFTQIKNLELSRPTTGGSGIHVLGVSGGGGLAPRIENNVLRNFGVGIHVEVSNLLGAVANSPVLHANVISCEPNHPGVFGIRLTAKGGSPPATVLGATVQANHISNFEFGIRCEALEDGVCAPQLRDDVIYDFFTGIDLVNCSVPILHETVVSFSTIPGSAQAIGIHADLFAVALVRNTLVWIPGAPPLFDDLKFDVAGSTFDFSISNDAGDCALGVGNLCPLTVNFANAPMKDFSLSPLSVAVDAADTSAVVPGGPTPLATDHVGAPRLSDGLRRGTACSPTLLNPCADIGAYELNPTSFGIRELSAFPPPIGYDSLGRVRVDGILGQSIELHFTGLPSEPAFFTLARDTAAANLFGPGVELLGNFLSFPPLQTTFAGTIPASGPLTMQILIPNDPSLVESEMILQGMVIAIAAPALGNTDAAVLLEINE